MNLETLAPYALPLAMGLAGAALYHLGAAFLRYIFEVEAYNPENVMHVDGWAREALMTADAKANVRLDALEERMGKVEEQLEPTPLRFTNPNTRFYPYAPYGAAGKPCPKPTKDLRPGDEVSVKMQVVYGSENTVKLILAHKDYANSGEAFVARGDLDSMRTDV